MEAVSEPGQGAPTAAGKRTKREHKLRAESTDGESLNGPETVAPSGRHPARTTAHLNRAGAGGRT